MPTAAVKDSLPWGMCSVDSEMVDWLHSCCIYSTVCIAVRVKAISSLTHFLQGTNSIEAAASFEKRDV